MSEKRQKNTSVRSILDRCGMSNRKILYLALSLTLPLIALVALWFILGSFPTQAQGATTHHVAPGGDCGGASPCYATIQAAVDAASDEDTIKVAQGVYTSTGFQVVYINKAITLTGGYTTTNWANSYPFTQPTVIDGENVARRRGVYIDGTGVATLTLEGLTIQQGYAQDTNGGGVYILTGTVMVRESQVLSNTATGSYPNGRGGGVYVQNGTVALSASNFQGNSASRGGGVSVANGTVTLTGNTFQSNSAASGGYDLGGGVYVREGTVTLTGNTFQSNSADEYGGGVSVETYGKDYSEGIVTLAGNTFQSNSAGERGGGVHMERECYWGCDTITLSGNTFHGNSACDDGGGVYVGESIATLTGNTFQSNSAGDYGAGDGGGVYVDVGPLDGGGIATLTGNTFQSNSADQRGGGVFVRNGTVTLSGNTFQSNSADYYGGGVCVGPHTFYAIVTLTSNTFHGNSASLHGGGVYVQSGTDIFQRWVGTVILSNNTLQENTAGQYGGGIAIEGGIIKAQNDIIADNTSPWEGVYLSEGTLAARHWTLADNGNYALTTIGGSATLTNTIVASHTIAGLWGPNIVADHTLFFDSGTACGGGASCTNNLSGDPKFVNQAWGDYHIDAGSAAIDVGVDAGVTTDIDGDSRPQRGGYDIGADEYPEVPPTPMPTSTPTKTPVPPSPTPTPGPYPPPVIPTPIPTPPGVTYPAWSIKAPMPTARAGLGLAAVNNKIYAIGGRGWARWYETSERATVEQYDPSTDAWQARTSMSSPRVWLGVAVVQDKIYAIGGFVRYPDVLTASVEEYDPTTDTWISKSPMPTSRAHMGVGVVNDKIYVIGGQVIGTPQCTSVVEEYDPATDTWTTRSPMPSPRAAMGVGVVDGKLYVISGHGLQVDPEYSTAIEVYDPATDTWTIESPAPRYIGYAGWAVVRGRIYALGGQAYNGSTYRTNAVEEFDPATGSWHTLSPTSYAREVPGATALNGKIYVIGGQVSGQELTVVEEGDLPEDTTAPTGSMTINGGAIDTTSTDVVLGLSASDDVSGVYSMSFSNDEVSYSDWESYVTSKPWVLTGGDGLKLVYVRYKDNARNISTYTDTINLDTTVQPEYGLSINKGALFTNQITVTLTLSANPHTAQMMVSNDGGFAGAQWEPYATHKEWQITQYGAYVIPRIVYAKYKDTEGVISGVYQDDIILDVTAPNSSITNLSRIGASSAARVNALSSSTVPVAVEWEGSDDVSGVKWYDVQYKQGSAGTWTDWLTGTTQTSATFNATPGHTYYLQSRAEDHAGNWEDYPGGDGDAHIGVPGAGQYRLYLPIVMKNHTGGLQSASLKPAHMDRIRELLVSSIKYERRTNKWIATN